MPAIRNPKATCATCPYCFIESKPGPDGKPPMYCQRVSMVRMHPDRTGRVSENEWCGEHPEFLLTENNP